MDYPHLKADCFRNACLSLGKTFGRDLNRKFIDTYKAMLAGLEAGESRPQAKQLPELLPGSVEWQQGIDYLVKGYPEMKEAVNKLRAKRHISEENEAEMIKQASLIVSQKQNSL